MRKHGVFHYIITVLENLLVNAASTLISIWVIAGGYIVFSTQKSPYNLIFGFPLMLIAAGLAFHFLWTIILVIFSPIYNRGVCKLCRRI